MPSSTVSLTDYRALAEMRYRLRRFMNFSEESARKAGVEPQQHQLLLAIRGLPADVVPTIRALAGRLQIQHHSAVELVRRSADNGLVLKRVSERDRREVLLEVSPKGLRLLERLAVAHRTELRSMAPALVGAIEALVTGRSKTRRTEKSLPS